jgi:hypothetical protein
MAGCTVNALYHSAKRYLVLDAVPTLKYWQHHAARLDVALHADRQGPVKVTNEK